MLLFTYQRNFGMLFRHRFPVLLSSFSRPAKSSFWTGPNTWFDFGLVAGAREWFSASTATNGTGATFTNNITGSLTARVRAGIAVAGMLNVSITNDSSHPLSFILITIPAGEPAANCPSASVIAEVAEGNASGTIPVPYYDSELRL